MFIEINNPPVNATSTSVRAGLMAALIAAEQAEFVFIKAKGKTFIAGGDVKEFDHLPQPPHLPDVVEAIENCSATTVAFLYGHVLGGGFEIAMACDWRIAKPGTRFGLPEVNLGLVPGAGGSQRAPRLLGWDRAVQMACFGKLLDAETMLDAGGIDALVDDFDSIPEIVKTSKASQPISKREILEPSADWLQSTKLSLQKRARGQKAPLINLDALLWATQPYKDAQPKERKLHLDLRASDESKALRYIFQAERATLKPRMVSGEANPQPIRNVLIVGGGLMGRGIALACLSAGIKVQIVEQTSTEAERCNEKILKSLEKLKESKRIDQEQLQSMRLSFAVHSSWSKITRSDLAIEAVFEDLEVKRQVMTLLENHLGSDTLIATNTSYLNPVDIFAPIQNKARCVGIHFFSPANIMKLVEIIPLTKTSNSNLEKSFAFSKKLGKSPVKAGICDGFIGNRMLAAYRRAAEYMLADGALPNEIDDAMRAFGMAMGPFEAQDLSGLQIAWANRRRQDATRPKTERYVTISDQLYDLGRLGQSTSFGWYKYAEGSKSPQIDHVVTNVIMDFSAKNGVARQPFKAADIQDQLLAVLANEGARIVEEGIASTNSEVDVVQVNGYGFPRWQGGPMHYASSVGFNRISAALEALDSQSPGSWVRAARFSYV